MALPFDIEVVAADHKVYSGQAVSVVAPGADGYFGIMAEHAPMIAALKVGILDITPPENLPTVEFAISGGFLRVDHDRVTILADTAELATEIDIERARQAMERAEERLHAPGTDINVDRAQAALMRALNRLRVAGAR